MNSQRTLAALSLVGAFLAFAVPARAATPTDDGDNVVTDITDTVGTVGRVGPVALPDRHVGVLLGKLLDPEAG
ncbi:hypothetical protein AB0M87_30625 [Streptomyces sp. NPDC051320]|uniref:hypothetical protein n=1 Tax=unclassified Streptomyces TaxID=2593676 RepID=UPI003431A926